MLELSIIIALTVGLTEAVKRIFKMPSRFAPAVSLLFGLSLTFLNSNGLPLNDIILAGIIVGLTASGLFDVGVKTIAGK